jgi:TP901 family phage tail tape measure protein
MATLQSTLKLTLLDQVSARARHITGVLNNLQNQQRRMLAPFTGGLAQFMALAGVYVGVTQGIQGTIGAALSFESAFADVRKVVDASEEQLKGFERSIRKLSTVIPATANDLAKLYAAGAESGIATDELNKFAEMASRVGIAFDIPMEQAGDSLAKLKTQLGLTLTETGDLADAMNHLSNNMASKASDIQAFMLRVGALAEMGGLAKEEIAAMGSAMIAAGAQPEVAATAMQNVVKAMTRGSSAKASQKAVAKALGLNLPQLAKDMQKDAPKAIKKVLAAIAKQPKDRHISLLSDFFGDEAKAFAPLVNNIKLLDDALASVGDKTKYAGSAYREYIARANTTGNVLQVLQNKFAELGRSIGDDMLPGLKEAALGIGDVIDTLGSRATIFDQLQEAVHGFTNGLGLKGGIREAINELGDLLLGVDNGSEAADKLGRIFARFQQYGQQVKQFAADVEEGIARFEKAFNLKEGTVGDTLGTIASWGFTLGAASIGISMAAGAILSLGRALMVLSGASLLIGGAKGLAALFGAVSGATAAKTATTAAKTAAQTATKSSPIMALLGSRLTLWSGALFAFYKALDDIPHEGYASAQKNNPNLLQDLERMRRIRAEFKGGFEGGRHAAYAGVGPRPGDVVPGEVTNWPSGYRRMTGTSAHDGKMRDDYNISSTPIRTILDSIRSLFSTATRLKTHFPGKAADDLDVGRKTVAIDAASISAMVQPSGVQQVQVINPVVPNVSVNAPITVNGVADAQAAASSAASQLGDKVRNAVESVNSD